MRSHVETASDVNSNTDKISSAAKAIQTNLIIVEIKINKINKI